MPIRLIRKKTMESFAEISLSVQVSKAISELGYVKPSPIQAQTLPLLLGEPTDFIGLAATGTGKTAAFSIPLIEKIDAVAAGVQALILCPTRELALQVAQQVNLIGRFKRIRSVAIYGGSSYGEQIRGLREGAQVVVGTPGRVVDHIERGTLRLDNLTTIILDEADEMISMGFKDELEKILVSVPRESSHIWLFSATMSREVRKVADAYLREPKQVQVNREEMLSSTVEQYYYPTQEANKPEILCKLIEGADDFYGLVFCQTKALVVDLTQFLSDRGYRVDSLHGDKDQTSRERTMQAFRNRRVTILVCTDVASRGLDVKDITHVVNYSLPRELENYVHRIGRTARSGKTGVAMNLVTLSHRRLIYAIENLTKSRMVEGKIPTRREIGARKVSKQLGGFLEQPFHERAIEVMSAEWLEAINAMSASEVAGRFLTMMMPDVFNDRGEKLSDQKPSVQKPKAQEKIEKPELVVETVKNLILAKDTTPKIIVPTVAAQNPIAPKKINSRSADVAADRRSASAIRTTAFGRNARGSRANATPDQTSRRQPGKPSQPSKASPFSASRGKPPRQIIHAESKVSPGKLTRELINRAKPSRQHVKNEEPMTMNRRERRALKFGVLEVVSAKKEKSTQDGRRES